MKIPIKIHPCPILEAIVEIRFNSNFPDEAVFGIIYSAFQEEFANVEKLPILQLPEAIRSTDPNLIHKPHYSLNSENYIIQIGPKVFSIANTKEYVGWDSFSKKNLETFSSLNELKIIKNISRFGLRYINVFDGLNVYKKSKLIVSLDDQNLNDHEINLTSNIKTGKFISRLFMANNAKVELKVQRKIVNGSIIDIDVYLEDNILFENFNDILYEAHKEEKKLFFSLLNNDYINSLSPEY